MAQPALADKGEVEEDCGEDAAGDEERPQLLGANVADEGDCGVFGHGGKMAGVVVDDPPEEHSQEHGQPDKARDDGENPI